ncbi:v-SNARE N-terminal domain-containing protein [Paenibacillus wulumuqiensis]|uniref:hypothetical protein n=1 Tax=Paenibacillus wulumuqiensis TaxID=1567107 RepID=UPI0006193CD7|nr:hypothetical protein [Paenibacillus wulumuqiensis]
MDPFMRSVWQGMSEQEQQAALYGLLPKLPEGFIFKQLQRFERYGEALLTGIFDYHGKEFVFVPGDTVTLGWNNGIGQMDEATREDLAQALNEIDRELSEADELLNKQMSPVREVSIRPMLAERHTQSVGWKEITPADLDLKEDADIIKQLGQFAASDLSSYEVHEDYRFKREDEHIRIYLFDETEHFAEWSEEHMQPPFAVATEDEWEYLYGGGCRTLFPWGDSFDYTMNVRYFGHLDGSTENKELTPDNQENMYDLELPNVFGLCFLGDPYQVELTVDTNNIILGKGGDDGSGICGGLGVMLGYLPVATYYRNAYNDTLQWSDWIGYMHYRRIIRL